MSTQHGKVKVKRPGEAKARTIQAALWYAKQDADDTKNQNPFFKMGYRLVIEPVGVSTQPAKAKPGKKKEEPADDAVEQPVYENE